MARSWFLKLENQEFKVAIKKYRQCIFCVVGGLAVVFKLGRLRHFVLLAWHGIHKLIGVQFIHLPALEYVRWLRT
jgi:hypothetical protein